MTEPFLGMSGQTIEYLQHKFYYSDNTSCTAICKFSSRFDLLHVYCLSIVNKFNYAKVEIQYDSCKYVNLALVLPD